MDTNSDKQLVATDARYERAAIYVQPYFDERKRVFVVGGKEYASVLRENPARKETWYESVLGMNRKPDANGIIPETPMILSNAGSIPIRHAEIFHGEDGEMLLQIAMDNGYVTRTREEADGKPGARFYIRDDQAEARKTNKLAQQVLDALKAINDFTITDKRELAWALRKPVNTMPDSMVDGVINTMAMKQPDVLLKTLRGRSFKMIAFIQQCVAHGLLTQEAGTYRFAGEVIGMDEASTVAYLEQKKNTSVKDTLVRELQERLSGRAGTPTAKLAKPSSKDEDLDELPFDDEIISTGVSNTASA